MLIIPPSSTAVYRCSGAASSSFIWLSTNVLFVIDLVPSEGLSNTTLLFDTPSAVSMKPAQIFFFIGDFQFAHFHQTNFVGLTFKPSDPKAASMMDASYRASNVDACSAS
jgi:hypothetical protein